MIVEPFMPCRMYNMYRSKELEATLDNRSIGFFPITSFRVMKGWGIPPEDAWEYKSALANWPPTEIPEGIDELAKQYRIGVYQRVYSLDECKMVLYEGGPVVTTFFLDDSWFTAAAGKITIPEPSKLLTEIHCVMLIGYNDLAEEVNFSNSWGEGWGDEGYGSLPYSYFENYSIESWRLSDTNSFLPGTVGAKIKIYNYGVPDFRGGKLHVIDIYDHNETDLNGVLQVEELFVHPNYRFRGYGKMLFELSIELATAMGLPVIFWISQADCERDNLYVIEKIMDHINFMLTESSDSWATYKAVIR